MGTKSPVNPEKEVVLLKGQFEFLSFIVVKMFYGNRRSLLLLMESFGATSTDT